MTTAINPATVHKPLGVYHHVVRVSAGAETVHISGQVGVRPDGGVEQGAAAQAEQAFRNIRACLEAVGMGPEHLVKLVLLLTDAGDVAAVRAARTKVLGEGIAPASTLMVISALAAPELRVEIEAIAAKG